MSNPTLWKLIPASHASFLVTWGIGGLALLMAVVTVLGIATVRQRRAAVAMLIAGGVMGVQAALASSGVLAHWERRPPPFMVMMACMTALTVWLARSRLGGDLARRFSLAALVLSQAFRLPLELIMHQASVEGIMPPQLSYDGWNFDIITGFTAIPIAALLMMNVAPRWLVVAWNVMGAGLLLTVVSIATASMPLLQAFGSEKLTTWVAHWPFVWLPGVLVQVALLGHLLIWRHLRDTQSKACSA